jgi:hypothetical protein
MAFPNFSDVDLILRDPTGQTKTLPVHKVILAMNSEFFRVMLTGSFRESNERSITMEVPDVDEAVKLVSWFYTRNHSQTSDFPVDIMELAEQWLVPSIIGPVPSTIPYPWAPADFVNNGVSEDWTTGNLWESEDGVTFPTFGGASYKTQTSILTDLEISSNGQLRVTLRFKGLRDNTPRSELEKLQDYLQQYGFNLDYTNMYYGNYSSLQINQQQQRLLAQLILRNNNFSATDREFIQNLWKNPSLSSP